MSHYAIGEWIDFVRGLVCGPEREKMQAHLTSGCTKCNGNAAFLSGLAASAAAEREYDMPSLPLAEEAIRVFADRMTVPPRESFAHPLRRLLATLRWDTASGLQMAGVRAVRTANRRLLFEADNYVVDIAIDTHRETSTATVTGQVFDGRKPNPGLSGLPISLVAREKLIAETYSNSAGEFVLDYKPDSTLRLQIPVIAAGRIIEIPLEPPDELE